MRLFKCLAVSSLLFIAVHVFGAEQYQRYEVLPPQLNAKTIAYLANSNMDIYEVYGTVVIPLQPQFAWKGKADNAEWSLKGYQTDKHEMFGIPLDATKSTEGFNTTLLSSDDVIVLKPTALKQLMLKADQAGLLKMAHYKDVNFSAAAYVLIRIKSRHA